MSRLVIAQARLFDPSSMTVGREQDVFIEGDRIARVTPSSSGGSSGVVLMVEQGFPAPAALRAATLEAATLLGLADELGSIERGKLADLVGVAGDPSTDIRALRSNRFVIKDGIVATAPSSRPQL